MIKVRHYRIPESIEVGDRGMPDSRDVKRYSRGFGFANYNYEGDTPRGNGGATSLDVIVGGIPVAAGDTYCSLQDPFCYREGRREAAKRAIKVLLVRDAGISERDADDLIDMIS